MARTSGISHAKLLTAWIVAAFNTIVVSYDDDDDEIAYFTVRWKTRASFVYRTKNIDNNDKDSKNRKRSH